MHATNRDPLFSKLISWCVTCKLFVVMHLTLQVQHLSSIACCTYRLLPVRFSASALIRRSASFYITSKWNHATSPIIIQSLCNGYLFCTSQSSVYKLKGKFAVSLRFLHHMLIGLIKYTIPVTNKKQLSKFKRKIQVAGFSFPWIFSEGVISLVNKSHTVERLTFPLIQTNVLLEINVINSNLVCLKDPPKTFLLHPFYIVVDRRTLSILAPCIHLVCIRAH